MPQALVHDLQSAGTDRNHTVVHLRIVDHQEFIRGYYFAPSRKEPHIPFERRHSSE